MANETLPIPYDGKAHVVVIDVSRDRVVTWVDGRRTLERRR